MLLNVILNQVISNQGNKNHHTQKTVSVIHKSVILIIILL